MPEPRRPRGGVHGGREPQRAERVLRVARRAQRRGQDHQGHVRHRDARVLGSAVGGRPRAGGRRCTARWSSPAVVEADLHVGGGSTTRQPLEHANGIVHLMQTHQHAGCRARPGAGQRQLGARARQLRNARGAPAPAVDPRVKFDVGTLVRKGLSVTLRDPIGLYIAGWDDTGWTRARRLAGRQLLDDRARRARAGAAARVRGAGRRRVRRRRHPHRRPAASNGAGRSPSTSP